MTDDTIEEFSSKYNVPNSVWSRIQVLGSLGCDLKILNYSRHSKNLLSPVSEWIGIDRIPDEGNIQVNRSLTSSEIKLIRIATKYIGKSAGKIGNSLCLSVPNITKDRVRLTRDAAEIFVERMGKIIDRVNSIVPESERYEIPKDLSPYIVFGETDVQISEDQAAAFIDIFEKLCKVNR
jgi:hypothetical protein